MQLTKIRIKNYRLLIDTELEVDSKTTLIVGRNNTAKTSCFSFVGNVLEGKAVFFDDYPLLRRKDFYTKLRYLWRGSSLTKNFVSSLKLSL